MRPRATNPSYTAPSTRADVLLSGKEHGMRTQFRPVQLLGMLMIAAALSLGACGSGGAGTSSNQPTAGTSGSGSAGSTAAPAAGAAASQQGNSEIVISLNADPPKLDPAQSSALVDRQV